MNRKIISLAFLICSLIYIIFGLRLKMGTLKNMGPGFVPLVIGVLLLACTTTDLIRLFGKTPLKEETNKATPIKDKNFRAVIGILVCTTAYPLILESLNFVFSTFIVGFAMLILLKPRSIIFSFLLSLGMAVGCFLIFTRLFGVALPSGPLEALFF
jgi:hypothetical protein